MRAETKEKTRFVVQWCYELPKDEYGDTLHDEAKYRAMKFASMEQAKQFAATVDDQFGVPQISEQVYAIDDDILACEERTVWRWQEVAYYNVELPYDGKEALERITR